MTSAHSLKERKSWPRIKGFQGTSLLDFPKIISSIIFVYGCNFRCPFCYNKDLVITDSLPDYPETIIREKLLERKGFIDGVVITGGEPLLYDNTIDMIKELKDMGFRIKLDTNGSFPERLSSLINQELVDYIAMDIKSSPEKYEKAAGTKVNLDKIKKSLEIVKSSGVPYELRTTVVPGLVDPEDICSLGEFVKGSELHYLQQFAPMNTVNPEYTKVKPYPLKILEKMKKELENYVKKVIIRGI